MHPFHLWLISNYVPFSVNWSCYILWINQTIIHLHFHVKHLLWHIVFIFGFRHNCIGKSNWLIGVLEHILAYLLTFHKMNVLWVSNSQSLHALVSTGQFVKRKAADAHVVLLIQEIRGRTRQCVFLTCSRGIPTQLAQKPHFENHCCNWSIPWRQEFVTTYT